MTVDTAEAPAETGISLSESAAAQINQIMKAQFGLFLQVRHG